MSINPPGDGNGNAASKALPRDSHLGRWFWGTIVVMAAAVLILTAMAIFQSKATRVPAAGTTTHELVPSFLQTVLTDARADAVTAVSVNIGPLLDDAYAPVYAAIPAYTNFHYSVWGSYVELGSAAIADPAAKLEEMLFAGLEARLGDVTQTLDATFRDRFDRGINQALIASDLIGPLSSGILADARDQTVGTALGLVGAVGSTKVVASLIGKKIGAKIAAKAAGKAGAKWGMTATGAGTGAALCAWAGPGAAACAVGGGIAAWFAMDAAVNKLDAFMNREEFETELRGLIDEDRARRQNALSDGLSAAAARLEAGTEVALQDFTLSQLSRPETASICQTAADFTKRYEALNVDLVARNSATISSFQSDLTAVAGNLALAALVSEIDAALSARATSVIVEEAVISGQLPSDLRANRDLSGRLTINDVMIDFDATEATVDAPFSLRATPDVALSGLPLFTIRLMLEQNLKIYSDRVFEGSLEYDPFDAMRGPSGLRREVALRVPISLAEVADAASPEGRGAAAEAFADVVLTVRGMSLPPLRQRPACER
jgi:hypothetical protein